VGFSICFFTSEEGRPGISGGGIFRIHNGGIFSCASVHLVCVFLLLYVRSEKV
jgi:hypothetical protein